MATILVVWSGPNTETLFLPSPDGCKWNLFEIGHVVTEEQSFENNDRWQMSNLGLSSLTDPDF